MRCLQPKSYATTGLFDEILRKGFDGHNFIVGLGEHLRNLLVSQDARTTNLMEVPDSVKKKYAAQAQSRLPRVLTWLNIANQCDINYKTSKNQRLVVELALMKMAHVGSVMQLQEMDYQPEALKKKCSVSSSPEGVSLLNRYRQKIPERKWSSFRASQLILLEYR